MPLGNEKVGKPEGFPVGRAGWECEGLASWATGAAMALHGVSCVASRPQMHVLPGGEESSDDGELHLDGEVRFFKNDRE